MFTQSYIIHKGQRGNLNPCKLAPIYKLLTSPPYWLSLEYHRRFKDEQQTWPCPKEFRKSSIIQGGLYISKGNTKYCAVSKKGERMSNQRNSERFIQEDSICCFNSIQPTFMEHHFMPALWRVPSQIITTRCNHTDMQSENLLPFKVRKQDLNIHKICF